MPTGLRDKTPHPFSLSIALWFYIDLDHSRLQLLSPNGLDCWKKTWGCSFALETSNTFYCIIHAHVFAALVVVGPSHCQISFPKGICYSTCT